jgi:hypothetical protein
MVASLDVGQSGIEVSECETPGSYLTTVAKTITIAIADSREIEVKMHVNVFWKEHMVPLVEVM